TARDVHVLPLSREVDRAVLPFLSRPGRAATLHAHQFILLVPDTDMGWRVADQVEEALRDAAPIERLTLAADHDRPTAGFQGILQQVSWLCRRETEAGNR